MTSWSLSRRLVLRLTVSLTALWLVAVVAVTAVVYHEIGELFDSALQETAQRLLPLTVYEVRRHRGQRISHSDRDDHRRGDNRRDDDRDHEEHDDEERVVGGELEYEAHEEHLIYQLRDASGRVLLRSHDAPQSPFPAQLRRGFAEWDGWRSYTEAALGKTLYIQVAEPIAHRVDAVGESLAWLTAPLLLLVPMAGWTIFRTVRRSLAPIGAVRESIGTRNGVNLEPVLHTDMPDELAPIVADVNRLIERLAQALESERGFAANSAHELRTPVAAALAQAQRLETEVDGTAHQARVASLVGTLRKLGNLVEKLLQLARADAGIALSREPVDLSRLVGIVVDEFSRRSALAQRIRFEPDRSRKLIGKTDPDALGIVLRNVIENALTHGAQDGEVAVAVADGGAISIINQGPVIPAEQLPDLVQRFERAGATAAGSGLGLAIADTIMRQAGGSLRLYSPARDRPDGFEVELSLPGVEAE